MLDCPALLSEWVVVYLYCLGQYLLYDLAFEIELDQGPFNRARPIPACFPMSSPMLCYPSSSCSSLGMPEGVRFSDIGEDNVMVSPYMVLDNPYLMS